MPPQSGPGFNPYAPPNVGAQGPAWAQAGGGMQPLAERGTRLGARMIDGGLFFVVLLVMGVPGAFFGSEFASSVLAFLGVSGLAIYQWILLATTGQSLGKKWLGIRIVKDDGGPVDFVSAVLLRSWCFNVLTFVGSLLFIGAALPLVNALMIFGEERRCLHDHLAGTKVVAG